jgi:ribose-phosphate pyrophosphokinase
MSNVRLFGGSSHPTLTQEIADYLAITQGEAKVIQFSNDNFEIQLDRSVRQKDVFLLQTFVKPVSDHLLELLMMLDIARTSGARSIHAIIPYYSYARSDKKDAPRISVTGRLLADLMIAAGAQHVITMTLHSPQVHGFFNVHTDHLTAHSVFIDYFKQQDLSHSVVVSPDIGNAKRASKLAHSLDLPLAVGVKSRLSDDKVVISDVLGDVRGKRALITDDEIATGGSMIELARVLKEKGAGPIVITATHGLFTKDAAVNLNMLDNVEAVVVTNTVPVPPERRPNKLITLSVAHIFGEVIRCTISGKSVGSMFEFWPDTRTE